MPDEQLGLILRWSGPAKVHRMDAYENMAVLHRLGALAAARDVKDIHFAPVLDLPAA